MNIKYYQKILITLISLAASASYANEFRPIKQWVKINADFRYEPDYRDRMNFDVSFNNLEGSVIQCGNQCKILKLKTTPYHSNGAVVLNIHDNCSGETLTLPFFVPEGENVLKTATKTYHISFGGGYVCYFRYVDVIVTQDSEQGYQVNLVQKGKYD